MKSRVLVAVIAIPLLLMVVFFLPLWAWSIVIGAIACVAAWELIGAIFPIPEGERLVNPRRNTFRMRVYSCLAAFLIPLLASFASPMYSALAVIFLLFAALFCEMMAAFREETPVNFPYVSAFLLAGGIIPLFLGSMVRLGLHERSIAYLLMPLVVSFVSDSGAYFAGLSLGKHKLCPNLSPKKTIEGSIGGFVSTIAAMLIYGLILKLCKMNVNFLVIGIYGLLGSLATQLGDLCFSAIKRIHGIKDYGNLLPGHGGMLDRFDGMIWSAALLELLANWVPAVW